MLPKVKGSAVLYFLDLICMISALGLLGFILYVTPYVLFNYQYYNVPRFVVIIHHWFVTHHTASNFIATFLFFAPLILACIALLYISKLISFYLETHEYEPGVPHIDLADYEEHIHRQSFGRRSYWSSSAVVIALIIGVLGLLGLLEYFVVINILQ